LLNPSHAPVSLQSVFHPAYAKLHQEADKILAQPCALVFKGESGEVEMKPQADSRAHLLRDRRSQEIIVPRSSSQRSERIDFPSVMPLQDLWRGAATDQYGLAATLATTAIALVAISPGLDMDSAREKALLLWQNRDVSRLH
jgi:anthranilate phosphoribosyltransferase